MYLQTIMSNYLNESSDSTSNIENNFNPLEVKKSDWIYSEKSIRRAYDFKKKKFLEAFIVEIIKYKREADADIEVRFRDMSVGIIIHAYSSSISEIERDAVSDIQKIKKDVMYYYADEK